MSTELQLPPDAIANGHIVGDRLEVRDADDQEWKIATIVEIEPEGWIRAMPDGWVEHFRWKQSRPLQSDVGSIQAIEKRERLTSEETISCMNASAVDRTSIGRIHFDQQKTKIRSVDGGGGMNSIGRIHFDSLGLPSVAFVPYEPLFLRYRAELQRAEQRQQRSAEDPLPPITEQQRSPSPSRARLQRSPSPKSPKSARHHKPRSEPPAPSEPSNPDPSKSRPPDAPPAPPPPAYALGVGVAQGVYSNPKICGTFVRKKRYVEVSERRAEAASPYHCAIGSNATPHAREVEAPPVNVLVEGQKMVKKPVRRKEERRGDSSSSSPKAVTEYGDDDVNLEGVSWDIAETDLALSFTSGVIDSAVANYIQKHWQVETVEDYVWPNSPWLQPPKGLKAHAVPAPHRLGELKKTPRKVAPVAPEPPVVAPTKPSMFGSGNQEELKRLSEEKRKMMARLAAIDRRPEAPRFSLRRPSKELS